MLLVGLTGGIGAGKSTVAKMLEERGAVVIDADDLARRAVEPGSHGYAEVIRTFGPEAVGLDGNLDRSWLARRVFTDDPARRALEAITHPEVARLFARETERWRGSDRVVVYAVPLLVENGLEGTFDVVVTVEAPNDVRVSRLVSDRRMREQEAWDRIRAQASEEERRRVAQIVVANGGGREELRAEVDRLWDRLSEMASAAG